MQLSSRGDCIKLEHIGGKGYNLIVLAQGEFLVPHAFIIREEAFREYISLWQEQFEDSCIESISDEQIGLIQSQFDHYEVKYELAAEIQNQLHDLQRNSQIPHPLLAVRSSGIAEDLENASFAGMNDSILNVKCELEPVIDAVKKCWRSLFSRRSIQYRIQHGLSPFDTAIAVIIQVMIPATSSGVVFTADPQTGSLAHISLDGVQGMGEPLMNGQVNTDHWIIRKPYGPHPYSVEEERIGNQLYKFVSNYPNKGTTKVELSPEEANRACFSREEVLRACLFSSADRIHLRACD